MNIEKIKIFLRPYYMRWWLLPSMVRKHESAIHDIRNRGYANVVFFASNLSQWRYQGIVDLMDKDDKFRVSIILVPLESFSAEENQRNIRELGSFFDEKQLPFIDSTQWKTADDYDIRKKLQPDIMFYVQPYDHVFGNALDSKYYYDKLLCYLPYGIFTLISKWSTNTWFQNFSWKLFYETEDARALARKMMYNGGRNVIVVGNPNADAFLKPSHEDVWKPQNTLKKRIIWAPHFTIDPSPVLHRGSFLWLWEAMLQFAREYKDCIQFAFKPHPRLKSVLYGFPDWGKERTDAYYAEWDSMANTQLETSGFVDLFMTSDAMIHDCASFTIEYQYCKKPAMFVDAGSVAEKEQLIETSRRARDLHYKGKNVSDVKGFIDRVVLGGDDPKKEERRSFFEQYLLPPNNKTVAQNVYDEIVHSLWK